MITQHAHEAGFSVAIDHPFEGTIVPLAYQGDARVRSVMIEFNKRLYLEPWANQKSKDFASTQQWGESLLRKLEMLAY
jgi:N-formylglutamate amidohydrolase